MNMHEAGKQIIAQGYKEYTQLMASADKFLDQVRPFEFGKRVTWQGQDYVITPIDGELTGAGIFIFGRTKKNIKMVTDWAAKQQGIKPVSEFEKHKNALASLFESYADQVRGARNHTQLGKQMKQMALEVDVMLSTT